MGPEAVLVTGAAGFVGRHVCDQLRCNKVRFVASDLYSDGSGPELQTCDISDPIAIADLLRQNRIGSIIHLAAVLPSAAAEDPAQATRVNLTASANLLTAAVQSGIRRFIFASSMSVYGGFGSRHLFVEDDPTSPIDLYGGAKRYIEMFGDLLSRRGALNFVTLRIAGVVGAGANSRTSAWRSEIFEKLGGPNQQTITLPFEPGSILSLVHVEDVAGMLVKLVTADRILSPVYNTPAENWPVEKLIERLQSLAANLSVNTPPAGGKPAPPLSDGSRFSRDFEYRLPSLDNRFRVAAETTR
jgi:UDP-glucose 4-epimerase